jgi:hypothetical protein
MNSLLRNDQVKRPDLFHFRGAIPSSELNAWINERQYVVPSDLKQFWHEMGGGDLFESETILSPFGQSDLADDVDTVNRFHKEKGMPGNWIVFHIGLGGLSVVQVPSGLYASVREGPYYEVQQTFTSFADWYADLIHREYASRYGLAD